MARLLTSVFLLVLLGGCLAQQPGGPWPGLTIGGDSFVPAQLATVDGVAVPAAEGGVWFLDRQTHGGQVASHAHPWPEQVRWLEPDAALDDRPGQELVADARDGGAERAGPGRLHRSHRGLSLHPGPGLQGAHRAAHPHHPSARAGRGDPGADRRRHGELGVQRYRRRPWRPPPIPWSSSSRSNPASRPTSPSSPPGGSISSIWRATRAASTPPRSPGVIRNKIGWASRAASTSLSEPGPEPPAPRSASAGSPSTTRSRPSRGGSRPGCRSMPSTTVPRPSSNSRPM